MKNYLLLLILFAPLFSYATIPAAQSGYPVEIQGSERDFASSPTIADLNNDGVPEIIFGDQSGMIWAINGSTGAELWRYNTTIPGFASVSIESKPAVADINHDGMVEVVVTAGSTHSITTNNNTTGRGSLTVLNGQDGTRICRYIPGLHPGFNGKNSRTHIYGSAAIANLDSDPDLEIAFGDWGFQVSVLNVNVTGNSCSPLWQSTLPQAVTNVQLAPNYDERINGVYVNDTVWSSPAIADFNNDGKLDVIIGVDSHNDNSPNQLNMIDGGRILVINGDDGTLQFAINSPEVIWSSPVIADLDKDGNLDLVVAMGYCWQASTPCSDQGSGQHSVSNKIYAYDKNGNTLPGWPYTLPSEYAVRNTSVAVGDIDKDGFLEVIVNAFHLTLPQSEGGRIFSLEHTGTKKWDIQPNIPTATPGIFKHFSSGSATPLIADITNDGDQNIIVPSNFDLVVYNADGSQVTSQVGSGADDFRLRGVLAFLATPTIGDIDDDGDLEIIAIGGLVLGNQNPKSTIYAWDLTTPTSSFQPWTSFRNSNDNTGNFKKADSIFSNGFE